jgi:hypothetical protein
LVPAARIASSLELAKQTAVTALVPDSFTQGGLKTCGIIVTPREFASLAAFYVTAIVCTSIGQWRRRAESGSAGPVLPAYEANAELPVDNINLAMVKTNQLYTKLAGVLSNWLAHFDPATMTTADGLKAVQLVAPSLDLAALRVEIGEQRMKETEDVTRSGVPRD